MREPKSTATIVALADLADFSANQLENGHSVENVIALLRRAALAVRETVDIDLEDDELTNSFEPVVISGLEVSEEDADDLAMEEADKETAADREPVSA